MNPSLRAAALAAFFAASATALAAPFTPGNVVVYRVGVGGATTLVNTGSAVFLDEFTPAGALVQSIALPTTVSGANKQLIASGTANTEGLLTRSTDGRFLVLTGYASNIPNAANLTGTSSATVNRTVGRVDANGNVDTTTALTNFTTGASPRGAASTDGTNLWLSGGANSPAYTTLGATTVTQISTTVTNLRGVSIYGGQLYISTASGTAIRIGSVGSGTPTTAGQTITNINGYPAATGGPYAFFFADLNAGVAGVDTLWVADDTAQALTKYSLVSGSWTSNGTIGIASDGYRGVTGVVSGSTVTLFATRKGGSGAAGGGELVKLVDASGYNGAFSGTPTLLTTAATNTAYRGVALTPLGPPSITSLNRTGATPTNATSVSWTAVFDQDVNGVDSGDFSVVTTGTTSGSVTGVTPVNASTYTVTVTLGGGSGTVGLNLSDNDSITSVASGLPLGGTGAGNGNFTGQTYTIDRDAPSVSSIIRANANPTSAAFVDYTVTFSESVTGVGTGDFALTVTGLTGTSISGVTGAPGSSVYTVTVNTGAGTGTVRLDVVDDDSILDGVGNPLGGVGAGNGDFTTGQVYDVDHTVPQVSAITRASTNPTSPTPVDFTVTFNTNVTGVDSTDFAIDASGVTGATVSNVTGSNATYTVTVSGFSGSGTLSIDLIDDDSIVSTSTSAPLGGPGAGNGTFTAGQAYTVDGTAPTVQSFVRVGPSPTNAATVNYTLTFSEAVSGVDSGDISITTSAGSTVGTPTSGDGGTTWTVPITTGGPTDTITLAVTDDDSIADAVGNKLGGTGAGNGNFTSPDTTVVDKLAPSVSSIVRASADPSSGPTVDFTVTFSEGVTGVNAADFVLTTTGSVSGTSIGPIAGASGSSVYTVTVNTGGGSGTLRLDVVDDDSIADGVGNKLGGTGAGNGNFNTGEFYTLNQPIPPPQNLIAGAGDGKVVLTWSAVGGATSYTVKRSATPGGPYTNIAPGLVTTTYTDNAVTNATRYYYVVSATDGGGEGGNSAESRATPNLVQALGLVISQVYGGGGNSGSVYTNDFIEIFNRGGGAVNVNGWSVQYNSATGTGTWVGATPISGQILPGHYYLVQEAAGAGGTTPLPAPDANGSLAIAATAGKVALVSNTTVLNGCPAVNTIADLVGFGTTANCFEGSAATPAPSNTNSVFRALAGCKDTQQNGADFTAAAAAPRNSASAPNGCGLNAVAGFLPITVPVTTATTIIADVVPGVAPPSTGITATADLSLLGGSASQTLFDDGTNGDVTPGDGLFSFGITVGAVSAGTKIIPVSVADAQARSANTAAFVVVTPGVETIAAVKVDTSPADTIPDRLGQSVQVRGVVTSIDFNGGAGIEYYIQDPTGGIDVFSSSGFGPFSIGTNVEVTGTITQFNGLTEINPTSMTTTTGVPPVSPQTVTLSAINESLEGQLVRVDNLTIAPGTFVADTNYPISDGSAGEMRIDGDTNIVGQTAPTGIFSLIGLVGQRDTSAPFDTGYQILPRSTADIIPRTPPTGSGASNPPSVAPGQQSLLTVTVTPGGNPPSTGITVVADLTAIGGSATQTFFDNATNGDVTAGDNVFSFLATVNGATSIGAKSMPATISDAQARNSSTNIPLNVQSPSAPPVPTNLVATPGNAQVGLTWNASAGATGYNVKRSTVSGGPYSTIAPNIPTTSYTDFAVVNGTTYYYVVSALTGAAESGDSSQVSALPSAPPPSGSLAKVYFVDIGQGAGTLVVSPTGKTLLIDGGPTGQGNAKVIPLLNTLGISTIDYTIVTHYHVDHDAGMTEVINAGRVAGTAYDNGDGANVVPPVPTNSTGTAFTAYKNAIAAHPAVTRQTITAGTVIDLGGGMKATCLAAGGHLATGSDIYISPTDLNSESIATLIEYNNFDFLVSGDLTGGGSTATAKTPDVETWVAQLAKDVDVVQLDHHGSTTANNRRFLNILKAEVALASAGASNTFGHPNRETANKYLNTPATSGNTYTGTGIPNPGNGPVFYQTDPSPVGDTRCTLQGYSGASTANAGLGTILLTTDGTTSFTMESFDDAGARLSAAAHVYALDATGAAVTTNFPPTVVPNVTPAVPLASEIGTVQALVQDREDPITSVTLDYSLNGAAQAPVSMTPVSGVYQANIPAQPDGTRVDYTITAVAGGASTTYTSGYFSGTTPIATLRALTPLGEPLYLDYAARISGLALSGTGNYSASSNDDYVSDATGALNVFRTIEPTSPAPQPTTTGNTYTIAGVIGQNLGRFRLEVTPPFDGIDKPWATTPGSFNPYTIVQTASGGAPVPEVKTIAQILAGPESLEAHLLQIANVTVTSGTIPASDNGIDSFLTISDGTGSMQMKIDHDSDIPGLPTPAGTFTLTGILQQDDPLRPFDTLYSMTPRNRTDLGAAASGPALISIATAREDIDPTTFLSPDDYVPDRLNQTVKIRGVVTSVNFRGSSGIEYYIQDPTGGIDIFNSSAARALSIGDNIEVIGVVKQFNGLTEIDPGTTASNIVLLAPGTLPAVTPEVVTLSQIGNGPPGENHEGKLLRINNVTLSSPPATFGANTNYTITDATGSGTIRIDSDTDIDGTAPPAGTFSIIGVLGQFDTAAPLDSGYQLFPRIRASDFLPAVPTPTGITATAGTPQSTVVNTDFATQLQAKVTDAGSAGIDGLNVVFTAPASGASGTFPGGVTSVNVTTSGGGFATAPVFTANTVAGGPYIVTATTASLTANFSLTNLAPPPPVATHFSVTAPASVTVGTPFTISVTALDASNATVTGYTGTVHFTSSGSATLPSDYTFIGGDAGTHNFSATLTAAGLQTITATDTSDGSITGSANVTGNAPAPVATHYNVSAPASVTVGVPFNVTVTALDASNATVSGYTGTVHFTTTGSATLPADYTFTGPDSGSHTFSVTATATGGQTITATDTVTASITGNTTVTASAPPPVATHYSVTAPATVTVGVPFSVTVTALDASNATVTGYTGTVHFTTTGSATLPADYTFVGGDNGSHIFSVTATASGGQTITATDTVDSSINGNAAVTANPPAPVATHFSVTAPATVIVGTPFSVTVTALDASNATVTGYTGTVHFTTTGSATLPADYTFTGGDAGSHTFSVTATASGGQTITATDTVTASITGSASITANPPSAAPTTHYGASFPPPIVGTPFTFVVSALDASNAVTPGYTGTVHFTSSAGATVPPDYTYVPADNGIHSFTITVHTPGAQNITVTDVANSSITSTFAFVAQCPTPAGPAPVPLNLPACAGSRGNTVTANLGAGVYNWTMTGGTITAGQGTPTITYTVNVAGTLNASVTVTDANGCAVGSNNGTSAIHPIPTVSVPGAVNACPGQPVTITARLTGTPPFNLTWSDGFHQNGVTTATAVRTLTPSSSRTLRITAVTDATSCASGASRDIFVTVNDLPGIMNQPEASQTIRGGERAHLHVVATGGALHYQWYEGEPGDESKPVGLDIPELNTDPLTASKVYWVKVSNGCGTLASQRAEVIVVGVKRRPKS